MTFSTAENVVKKTLQKRFVIHLDFEYFKQPVLPYYLHEDLVAMTELNKPEKVLLCSHDTAATYTISDLVLEYDAIIDAAYREEVSVAQQNSSYPYTRVTRLFYQILGKKDSSWLIDTKLHEKRLQGLLLLFLEDQTVFVYKVENFYNPTIKKVNVTIDRDPHQLFKRLVFLCDMYQEIGKRVLQENSDVSFKEYLTSKYGLCINRRPSTDNKLHGSGRVVNSGVKLQIDKVGESSRNLTCYIFAIQDAYVHFGEGKLEAIDL